MLERSESSGATLDFSGFVYKLTAATIAQFWGNEMSMQKDGSEVSIGNEKFTEPALGSDPAEAIVFRSELATPEGERSFTMRLFPNSSGHNVCKDYTFQDITPEGLGPKLSMRVYFDGIDLHAARGDGISDTVNSNNFSTWETFAQRIRESSLLQEMFQRFGVNPIYIPQVAMSR